jgi:hypothetical protein
VVIRTHQHLLKIDGTGSTRFDIPARQFERYRPARAKRRPTVLFQAIFFDRLVQELAERRLPSTCLQITPLDKKINKPA